MSSYSKFKETYFDENTYISVNIGESICKNNLTEVERIIEKYFSTDETKFFLEGTIAYQSEENGGGKNGALVSPAFLAFEHGNRNVIKLIVGACGNPNLLANPDLSCITILMIAAENGDIKTIETLISLGANPNLICTADGGICISALGKAIYHGFQKTAEFLISCGAVFTINEAIPAVESGEEFAQYVKDLIKNHPEVLSQTGFDDHRTLLHHAAGHGKERIVRWLVENGANINARDVENNTPLWYADVAGSAAIVKFLKSKGALLYSSEISDDKKISKPEEITHLIERLEIIEDKLGVRFASIYCTQVKLIWGNSVEFVVEVNFDVIGTEPTLSKSFSPKFSAYNASGQLISTNSCFINNDRFLGIEPIKIQLICPTSPTQLRLFPAGPI